jgi:branched-chain amino acid transport system permease protein
MQTLAFPRSYTDFTRLVPSPSRALQMAAVVALAAALPLVTNSYALGFGTLVLIAAIGAVGFNILVGWAGLVSLGYAGFLAIGAYANAYFMNKWGWSFLVSLPAAGIVAGLASLLVGIPSLRLRGLYLAITTLAFSVITNHVILLAKPLTGGSSGTQVARPVFFGLNLTSDRALFYICLVVLVLTVLVAVNIRRSFVGRALFAIRDYEVAARVLGVNVVAYKLLSFAISSALIGVAGGLFGMHLRYLNVESFELLLSIEAVSIVIVGGIGSIPGVILGSAFMVLLPEVARMGFSALSNSSVGDLFSSNAQEMKGVIYGLVIILCLRFAPSGLIGLYRRLVARLRLWPLPY